MYDKLIVSMFTVDDFSIAGIARALKCSEDTVEKILRKHGVDV